MSKILAVDAGFANVGLAVMEHVADKIWRPVELACVQTEKCNRKTSLRAPDDNARRIADATRGVKDVIVRHGIKAMVVELPPGGAPRMNILKMLSLASGMIIAIGECFDMAVEYYTPQDTRRAAGVPIGVKDKDNVKKIVMEEMGRLYPELAQEFPAIERRNHVADALSCFEAAREGVLVRMIEARQ